MTFAWSPALATGCADIDNQHKLLFSVMNDLFDACQSGRERQEVERTIGFLEIYTANHFADEESLQEKYEYPEYVTHKHLHTEFKGIVQRLATGMSKDGPTVEFIRELCVTASEWLFNHIKDEDLRMAAYIQGKAQTA